jgi:deazaflavin-dependent oxidoreductase (nitroreductase family)
MDAQPPRRALAYNPTFQRVFTRIHQFWFRATGGRAGGRFGKSPVLILTTTGRNSGQPRSTPLFYLADGGSYVVVASNGGSDAPPQWWLNLRVHPDAIVELNTQKLTVQAREADTQERERFWPALVAMYGGYAQYQRRTTRTIPVVILDPSATEPSAC